MHHPSGLAVSAASAFGREAQRQQRARVAGNQTHPGLAGELAFSADLLELMRIGASQESSYGGF